MEKGYGMAPVRWKGGNRVKVKELEPGDLVQDQGIAAVAWEVIRLEDWERAPEPEKFLVKFFGTSEIAFVAPADIQLFTSASKRKLLAQHHSKIFKYFCGAVDEICEAFKNQLKNNSSDPGEVNDGKSIGLVSSSTVEVGNCGNLKHHENQLKNSSCDPKNVNDGNFIVLVSSSTIDTENPGNFEHHETIHLDAQLEKGSDSDACHIDELHDLEHSQNYQVKGSLGVMVKLLLCDMEVTGSSRGNNLFQKSRTFVQVEAPILAVLVISHWVYYHFILEAPILTALHKAGNKTS